MGENTENTFALIQDQPEQSKEPWAAPHPLFGLGSTHSGIQIDTQRAATSCNQNHLRNVP